MADSDISEISPFLIGLGCFFAVIGGWAFMDSYSAINDSLEVGNWQTAQATIQKSFIDERSSTDTSGGPRNTHISYRPVTEYKYEITGQTYTSQGITLLDMYSEDLESVQQTIDKYPVGSQVTIYIDPEDNQHTCIECTLGDGAEMLGIFGGFFGAIGLIMAGSGVIIRLNG